MSKAEKQAVINMKPSAYRSMLMGKLSLTEKSSKKTADLLRWNKEHWLNLNALIDMKIELPCGQKYKGQKDKTVCRPKYKINDKTPTPLAYNLSEKQIKKAIQKKNNGEKINWKKI
jgi:hypothetical protein